jgi:predicted nuclease of predicted toxin-antitoxin system
VKFLLDHDVPEDLTYLLQELGHEVLRLRDVLPQEASDAAALQFAYEHSCLLMTCSRDDFIDSRSTRYPTSR